MKRAEPPLFFFICPFGSERAGRSGVRRYGLTVAKFLEVAVFRFDAYLMCDWFILCSVVALVLFFSPRDVGMKAYLPSDEICV